MRHISRVFFSLIMLATLSFPQLKIPFEKYTLPNGLDVILHEDHSVPIVAVNVWYHVGSSREKKGKTGFAHLFEHMMFQGSQNVGDDQHFALIQEAGGTLNGSTTNDRTNYFEVVPSNFLELALWLEADRMGFLLPAMTQVKLDNQRDVVKNERRQGMDNQPYGRAFEKIGEMVYDTTHPYSWEVIGSMTDLSAASMDDVKEFFRFYYAPNNASLTVAGDFDPKQVKELVNTYFGDIPRGQAVERRGANQPGVAPAKHETMEDRVQLPRLYLAWHTSPLGTAEDAALDVLADVLAGGKNSRLYKSLVYEKQIAQDVFAFQYSRELAGLFMIQVTAKPGFTLSEIEKVVKEEIAKLQKEGAAEREIQRSKNSTKANYIYRLQSVLGKADQLNGYNVYWGDPGSFNKDLARYEKVSADDVKGVAQKYLTLSTVALSIVPLGKKDLEAK